MGEPLKSFIEPCLRFQKRQKETGIYVPFIFHAGECLGDGNATDENLYDAILLGTKRIGHGFVSVHCPPDKLTYLGWFSSFSLAKHPLLMELCKEKGIAIEVCPISYAKFPYSLDA